MNTSDVPLRAPSSHPAKYSTLKGLLDAVDRALRLRPDRIAGMSRAMWLQNAEYWARENFGDVTSIIDMKDNLTPTRCQDLRGGNATFGFIHPTRDYEIGDVVPAVGKIMDIAETPHGVQFKISGQWINVACLAPAAALT